MRKTIVCSTVIFVTFFVAILIGMNSKAEGAVKKTGHGDPSEWTWLGGTSNLTGRWDPCAAITWSTPNDGSPVDRAFSQGIRKIARFSGYTFQRVDGDAMIESTNRPTADLGGYGGHVEIHSTIRSDDNMWNDSALIVIGTEQLDPKWLWALNGMYLHELEHAMGLGHVTVDEEMMTTVAPRPKRLGLGDKAGLAAMRPIACAPDAISTVSSMSASIIDTRRIS